MSTYFLTFEAGGAVSPETLRDIVGELGDICQITGHSFMLESDFELDEIMEQLSQQIGDQLTYFIIDLETLEVDGANLPDCIEEFVATAEEIYGEEFEEFGEEQEGEE